MAGFWGSHMGLIDLLLEKGADGWKVISSTSEARPIWKRDDTTKKVVPTVQDVPEVEAPVMADHKGTLEYVRRPVGQTAAPLAGRVISRIAPILGVVQLASNGTPPTGATP